MKNNDTIDFVNPIKVQCFDKDGNLKWEENVHNGITDEGIEYLLEVAFRAVTSKISTWYVGLIDNSPAPTLDNGDTAAEIGGTNGWDEFVNYSGTNRIAWSADAEASRQMTNSTTADFTIDGAGGTVYGIFIVGGGTSQAQADVTGTLWSTAAFSSTATVVATDELKVTYTISG